LFFENTEKGKEGLIERSIEGDVSCLH